MLEVENKYYEMLKNEFLIRSIELKKIPEFWVKVIRNHHTLPGVITDKDWSIFDFLTDLSVDEFISRQKVKTFKLSLEFKENPYFFNNSLWVAVNNDDIFSYSSSGIDFKPGVLLKDFEDSHESFFKLFKGSEESGVINDPGFVYDIVNGIRIDLWEDPFKYYET
jgi:hypothetical protein